MITKQNACWYVIQCKPGTEAHVAHLLRLNTELSVFLPEYQLHIYGQAPQMEVLFPGYLFVCGDLQFLSFAHLMRNSNTFRLISFGGQPEPIPHSIIDGIEKLVQQVSSTDRRNRQLCAGDAVRVKTGPLKDLETIFLGPTNAGQRARILLAILGRQKEVQIDMALLEKTAPSSPLTAPSRPLHSRRTRGKGRRIHYSA